MSNLMSRMNGKKTDTCRDAKTEENMIDLVVSYIKLTRFRCLRSVSGV